MLGWSYLNSENGSFLWFGHYQDEFGSGINNFFKSFFVSLFDFQANQTSGYAGEMGYLFELCLIFVDNLEAFLC